MGTTCMQGAEDGKIAKKPRKKKLTCGNGWKLLETDGEIRHYKYCVPCQCLQKMRPERRTGDPEKYSEFCTVCFKGPSYVHWDKLHGGIPRSARLKKSRLQQFITWKVYRTNVQLINKYRYLAKCWTKDE